MHRAARRPTERKRTPKPGFLTLLKQLLLLFFLMIFILMVATGVVYVWAGQSVAGQQGSEYIVFTSETLEATESQFAVIKVAPSQPDMTVAVFSPQQKVAVLGGYGEYELRSLYSLLDLEHKSRAYQRAAFAFGLEQVVDAMWTTPTALSLRNGHDVKQLLQAGVANQIHTTSSWWHRVGLWSFARSLREDQLKVVQVHSLEEWKKLQQQWSDVHQAACAIAVVNTTQAAGLASKMTTILESSGFRVVRTTSESEAQPATKVIQGQSKPECEPVLAAIQHVLPLEPPLEVQTTTADRYRADVVLLLGEDVGDLTK